MNCQDPHSFESHDSITRTGRRLTGCRIIVALSAGLAVTSCADRGFGFVFDLDGDAHTRHYVVVGLGIVSLPGSAEVDVVTAARTTSLGLALSDIPGLAVSAGYANSQFVAAPTTANGYIVDVETRPTGAVRVTAPNPHTNLGSAENSNSSK